MFTVIVITPEINHPHEDRILHALVRAYNCTIHVRKPDLTEHAYRLYLSGYASILAHMVLHEHHALAKEFPVKGIHLKESDRKYATEIADDVKIISTGFHNILDIKNNTQPFEYIFYSPVFKSISKENYGTDHSPESLTELVSALKKETAIPIIALGGINEENIALVKNSGFDGAALLGAVWESEDPSIAFNNCLKRNA